MSGLTINENPAMTKYLVGEVRAFAQSPLTLLDIGARGGVNSEWKIFGDQVRIYCFEPDEAECARLMADASPQVSYMPYALGAASGAATLYEARLPASTGLYKTRMEYFGRLLNRANGVTVSERTVQVRTLDEVIREQGIADIDFIKADAEGAELDILMGGVQALDACNVLGVLSEVRFQQEINGSPTFSALDTFLCGQGFRLFDIAAYRQSRHVLPYPAFSNYRHPSGERFFAYTKRGQVQDGDALFFRDFLIAENVQFARRSTPVKLLKLCSLLELYSLNDCAAELILANGDALQGIVDRGVLLDLLSSGIVGHTTRYNEYLEGYFSDVADKSDPAPEKCAAPAAQSSYPADVTKTGLLRRLIRRFLS